MDLPVGLGGRAMGEDARAQPDGETSDRHEDASQASAYRDDREFAYKCNTAIYTCLFNAS